MIEPTTALAEGVTIQWNEASEFGARPELVIKLVIARVEELNKALPCYENEEVLNHLRAAMLWESIRNDRREAQGVKGTMKPHMSRGNTDAKN